MNRIKKNLLTKILPTILIVVLVFNLMPMPNGVVYAQTGDETGNENPDDSTLEEITDITVTATSEYYDGEEYPAAEVTGLLEDDVVTYQLDDGEEQDEMPNICEVGQYSLAVKVERDGYTPYEVTVTPEIKANDISLTVTPYEDEYDGEEHDALTIEGLLEGDTVEYFLNGGEATSDIPKIKNVDNYTITVSVKRANHNDYEETFTAKITSATIQGIMVTPYEDEYDGKEHNALTIEGLLEGDIVEYSLNGGNATSEIPQIKEADTYSITVSVKRANHNDYEETFIAKITPATIVGVTVTAYTGVYDGGEHPAVSVTGTQDGDTVEYKLESGTWTTEVPKIKDAKEYTVNVRVSRDNYETKEYTDIKAKISKAAQTLKFANYEGTSKTETVKGIFTEVTYDFQAIDEKQLTGGNITYSITLNEDNQGIATIDENTGLLTVTDAGTIQITAKLWGNDNYEDCTIDYTLVVFLETSAKGQLISFENATVDYVLGENNGVVSTQEAIKKTWRDWGEVTYSLQETNLGLACDTNTGEVTVVDYETLSKAMQDNNGVVTATITANKGETLFYGEDTVSYLIKITFMDTPNSPYITEGTIGENGWYTSDVKLKPTDDSYKISETCTLDDFTDSVVIDDKKTEKFIYLRDKNTGGITNRISYEEIKVDTIAPKMEVICNEPDNKVGDNSYYSKNIEGNIYIEEINFDFQNAKVMVTKDNGTPYEVAVTWTNKKEKHIGTFTLPANADGSTDGIYTFTVTCKDDAGNPVENDYVSQKLIIDKKTPVVTITYSNTSPSNTMQDSEGNTRKYFNNTQTATITVEDEFIDINETNITISAKDVAGGILDQSTLISQSDWSKEGNKYTKTINFTGEANYKLELTSADLATNTYVLETPDCFTVDRTAPTNLDISYSTGVLETILESVTFGFYNAKTQVTVTAQDSISGITSISYSYVKAAGVSNVNAESINQTVSGSNIELSGNGKTATAKFEIPSGALTSESQFNGNVEFTVTDRTGLSNSLRGAKRLVVDNISPTIEVAYNTPVQEVEGTSYYDESVSATLTINEANFYPEDIEVLVTKDGATPYEVTPTWEGNHTDIHVGNFILSEDGNYTIAINYTDKSNNSMETYNSELLVVDTVIEDPVITINGESESGRAYQGEVIPKVSFEDVNFEDYEVTLTRTRFGDKDVDVTDQFVTGNISVNETGGQGTFDEFEEIAENDGIYTLTVTMTDKAGHESSVVNVFTVNRFGSVYEYDTYLSSLVAEGGAYVNSITEDLVITEYNADRLVENSIYIEITCDGKPLDDVSYEISPKIGQETQIGDSGWFQYTYTIGKENFTSDGVYKISISSEDATGNTPENNNYEDKLIVFRVDNTVPEITSIVGLEENIVNAQEVEVKYDIYDTIGLKSVTVYVDGQMHGEAVTDFGVDINNYSGSFVLQEDRSEQSVQIVVEDLAGNVVDTNSQSFESAYAFNKSVTVSTNVLVRFTANKPLFFGSIGGVAVVLAAGSFFIVSRRRKKLMK